MGERVKAWIVAMPLVASVLTLIEAYQKPDGMFAIASALFFIGFAYLISIAYGPRE